MKENSINEDIAIITKLLTTKFNNDYSIDNKDKEAIEHILSDYKRVLKENEELKKNYTKVQESTNTTFDKIVLPPEPQLPIKTLCESFSKKRRNK